MASMPETIFYWVYSHFDLPVSDTFLVNLLIEESDEEWTIYQFRNKKRGKIPYPLTYNVTKERSGPVIFIPPSKKTIANHLNKHAKSYKDDYRETARDKRRQT
jgi:hypothetical protein